MTKRRIQEDIIRFALPSQLKHDLQALAISRNISLSALLRLVLSEYVKSKR